MSSLEEILAGLSPEQRRAFLLRLGERSKKPDTRGDEIRRRPPDLAPLPLSFGQERFWFLDQVEPDNPAFNIAQAVRFLGETRIALLAAVLGEVVRRHEVLRSSFTAQDGEPAVVLHPPSAVELPLVDLAGLPAERAAATALALARRFKLQTFALDRGPLFRSGLLRLAPEHHWLLFSMHHIVADGWSMGVMVREVTLLYRAWAAGRPSPLPELPIQYADYALWQRQELASGRWEEQLAYWRRRLAGAAITELQYDRPRRRTAERQGGQQSGDFGPQLLDRLKTFSRGEGATIFMTLLAAFSLLLARYTGEEDVVVGSVVANRNRREIEPLIGFFVNTQVLRNDLSGDPSFRQLVARVREVAAGARAHQDVPFERLVEALQPARDAGQTPFFRIMVALHNAAAEPPPIPGLTLAAIDTGGAPVQFDLTLALGEAPQGLSARFEFDANLFAASTLRRLHAQLRHVLEETLAGPDAPLAHFSLLAAAERHQLLREWNDERVSYPGGDFVHELFAERRAARPDRIAVVASGRALSYGELDARAERLAAHLRELGVRPESLVGIHVERSPEMVLGLLAILKAGGAYLPLDPSYPPERLAFMVEDAGVRVILTESRLASPGTGEGARRVLVDELPRAGGRGRRAGSALTPDHPAYVIYTSGSTGRPKGVVISHRSLANRLRFHAATDVDSTTRLLQKTSFSFDVSLLETFGPLLAGGCIVQARPGGERDVGYLTGLIAAERVTHTTFPPSLLTVLLDDPAFAACDSLQIVVTGSEAVPADLPGRFHARFAAELFNRYGPTECTIAVTAWPCRPGPGDAVLPIGRPIAGAQVHVLDRGLRPVPLGARGEIAIGGVCLARGYLARAAATAERFVPNPLPGAAAGARLYRSGDLARRRPDGALEFLGRIDGQVKVRGFRVELGEIEAALAAHPGVSQSVVLTREERPGEMRLVAYVVGAAGADLRGYLLARLPEYMVPAAIVHLPALPVNANGKVDRAALPAPDWGAERARFEAPRTAGEQALARIWAELLKTDRVGLGDGFFALGGDSILSIQLVARAARAGWRITPRQVFENPTLADLAAVAEPLAVGEPAAGSRTGRGPVSGSLPLTPIQRRFLAPDPVDPHHFNQSLLLRVAAAWQPQVVARAWAALLDHHDALRLRFRREVEGWRQWNEPPGQEPGWGRVDLSALPPGRLAGALRDAGAQAQASLDLARGPIARGIWFDGLDGSDLPKGEARLLLIVHHLAIDGVSWRVLLEDLATACGQLAAGAPPSLPARTTSYQDWAAYLAARAARWEPAALAAELAWWREETGAPAVALPVDDPAGGNRGSEADRVEASLSAEETQALLQEAPAAYRTGIEDLLLTALARTFAGSGQALRIDLEGHGREAVLGAAETLDLGRTVGWFTSLYPVRLAAGDGGPGAALSAVKEHLRSVPGRGLGWGLLRHLRPEGEAWAAPPPEISFNYLGQLDAALPAGSPFAAAREDAGPARSPRAPRLHLLDVVGAVSGGALRVSWLYSAARHRRSTVEAWAERFLSHLRELLAHCLARSARRVAGYTPADFPLARLRPAEIPPLLGEEWGIEDVYPLSPLQEGLAFETLLAPGSGVYVGQLLCRLTGDFDEPAFEAACRSTLDHLPVLRTSFHTVDEGRALQVVHGRVETSLARLDWRDVPDEERERRVAALLAADREQGFDIARPPLMRWTLARTGEDERRLLWTSHHLLLDGWSFSAVTGELLAAYRALRAGEAPRFVRRRPFRDYIAWLASRDLAETERYWRRVLAGWNAPAPLFAGEGGGRGYGHRVLHLPETLTAALALQARRHQLTLNTVVQAAWGLLLGRSTGAGDVVFGVTVSGRPADLPGVEEMVGLFINTLPVRLQLDEGPREPRLLAWLRELQGAQVELRQHEHSPLTEVHAWSEVPRGRALFDTILVFESYPVDESLRQAAGGAGGLGNVQVAEVRAVEQPHYPLTLTVMPGRTLRLGIDAARARFDEASTGRLLAQLETVLQGMAQLLEDGGDGRPSTLPLLAPAERQQLLEWSTGEARVLPAACLHELFFAQAGRTPERTAVAGGAEHLSYRELAARAERLARTLRRLGVGPEVAAGICRERSPELVVGLLAILAAGGAYVPLDPSYPPERLARMVEDARPPVILAEAGTVARLPTDPACRVVLGAGGIGGIEAAGGIEASGSVEAAGGSEAGGGVTPENLAYVIFTSGSTGRPKGAMNSHRAIVNRLLWAQRLHRLAAADRVLQKTPVSFDVSVWELFLPLVTGACLVMARPGGHQDPAYLARILEEREITIAHFVPAMLQVFLGEPGSGRARALRQVVASGEALPVALQERFFRALPAAALVNLYGPTEAAVDVTRWDCVPGAPVVPIGRPVANTRIVLLDGEGRTVPIGAAAELHIGGAQVGRGYLGRPDLTAERFVPDPAGEPGSRLYRTGDQARHLPGGEVEYLGRLDGQVKIRGVRIEPGEIEAALAAHPAVREAVVLLAGDGGAPRLTACVVALAGAAPVSGPGLRDFLRERLPEAMIPAAFVPLAALPVTPNGKVDRRALAHLASGVEGAEEGVYVAPRTPVEELLAAIWEEVLAVERVGAEDSFFALGGHSLLATRVISRVRQGFGVELPLRSLFEAGTVAGLARRVESALATGPGGGLPPLLPARRGDSLIDRDLPLSFAQERLWLIDQIAPGSAAYNMPVALRLRGELDLAALAAAWTELDRRHESLRTTFHAAHVSHASHASEKEARQTVHPATPKALPRVDLAALAAAYREGEARRLARDEARRPFDLALGPLLRLTLLRFEAGEHVLLVTQHHIVSDGWSIGVLVRELGALYGAFQARRPSPLPEPVLQYADFAVWQRQWLAGGVLAAQLEYWRSRLAGAPELLALPLDRPRASGTGGRAGRLRRPLAAVLHLGLRRLGKRDPGRESTLFMALLAAWSAFLSRASGQDDVVVGTPIANRTRREVEGLIGVFVNTLALRVDLAEDSRFAALLERVRQTTLTDFAHQDLPFERLVAEVAAERSLSHSPLFQVVLVLQNAAAATFELPGLTVETLPGVEGEAKFDLTLSFAETPTGFISSWEYRRDLFDATTVARFAAAFETLLAGAVEEPEARLAALPLLGAAERQQLLEWRGRETAFPREATIHELLARQTASAPDAVAVVAAAEHLSYGALASRATRLARRLRARGVAAGARIGLCLDRSPARIEATVAVLAAGCAYVPLDPAYPRERLDFLVRDSATAVLLTEEKWRAGLPTDGVDVVSLDRPEPPEAPRAEPPADSPADSIIAAQPAVPAGALAYVLYTSGSTGIPKGVAVPHRAVVRLVHGADYAAFGPDEVFLQLAPYAFDAATLEVWGALLHGGRLVLPPPGNLSLAEIGALLERHGITTLWLTAGLFHQMVDWHLPALLGVRQLLAGGDVLSPPHVRRALAGLPGTRLINGYGPTENTTFTCCFAVAPDTDLARPLPVGRPIANTRVHILDRHLQAVPPGVVGELAAGGDGLAWGYLGRPDLTAERFVPDPFGTENGGDGGERLYRTGDLARFRGPGSIDFLGRIDAQVKIRGFRVEPGEIETVLLTHPAVEDAAVVVRRDAGGEADDARLVACVVARAGQEPASGPALRAFLGERLPASMLPSAFVVLDALPLTPNGKVDRRALARLARVETGDGEAEYAAPRTPVEELVAAIWEEVLAVGRVGAESHFFALGGHSLLATRVISRVRQAFGVELPLRSLFEATTVATFARQVEAALAGGPSRQAPPLVPVRRGRDVPLSFAQERLWLIDRLQPGSSAYNIPAALRLAGHLDRAALEATLAELDRRHESLRTTFREAGGQVVQQIHPASPPALPHVDLAGLPAGSGAAEARRLTVAEARRPFDLAAGPLLRFLLVRQSDGEHVALLTQHHIVSDGWSLGVLVRELGTLYAAFHRGLASPLPEPVLQYADFAVWQRAWLSGGELEAQLDYWRSRLAGAPDLLALPLDRPRAALPSSAGGRVRQDLPAALVHRLRALGRSPGREATLFMVLLAAWSALLSRLSGQEDVVVGSPIANRNHREVEGLIGFFVNTLALRTDLKGDPPFSEVLGRVRQATLADYAHQDLPFERLVGEVVAERSLSHSPLFQVLFTVQDVAAQRLALPGLTLETIPVGGEAVKLDLSLGWSETAAGLTGGWQYRAGLFDRTTVMRLAAGFERLLAAAAERPEARLSELPLTGDAEHQQLVREWSGESPEYPREASIPELFAAQARRAPEAVALVSGAVSLTYRELDRRAGRLARTLRSLGVTRESLVGLCLDRSPDWVLAALAVLKAGGAYVPLDPSDPRERLARLAAGTSVLVTEERWLPVLPTGARTLCLDRAPAAGDDAPHRQDEEGGATGSSLAYVMYTSGSTGEPKGVAIPHRAVVRLAFATGYTTFGPGEVFLQSARLAFDAATLEIWGPLLHGGRLAVPPPGPLSLAELGRQIERYGVTKLLQPAGLFQQMVTENPAGLRPVRHLLVGGDVLSAPHVRRLLAELPGTRVINCYGPTESTCIAATFAVTDPRQVSHAVPIGRPIAHTTMHVLDRSFRPVPIGVTGELAIGGDALAAGYLGRPDLTAERFVPSPFGGQRGERLYRTGDLGRFTGLGELEFFGRIDSQVKIRGFRVEPGEVEVILGRHPAIREAAVLVRTDDSGDRRLVAYLVLAEDPAIGSAAGLPAIEAYLADRLPVYLVPSAFVVLPVLPLSVNGKVDRSALPDPEWSSGEDYVAPRTPVEEILAALWSEVLGLPRVGVEDDFFRLGGHSLLATRLVSRIREGLGVDLPLRRVFESPTIAGLAAGIAGELAAVAPPPLLPAVRPGALPLSFAQERLWFLDQLDPGTPTYNMPLPVRLSGALRPAVLGAVLGEVVRRHEVLRTVYPIAAGRPVQAIAPPVPGGLFPLPRIDLTGLPEEPRSAETARLAAADALRPFDLARGPVVRAALLDLAASDTVLLLALHHIACDGWSVGVLLREVAALYAAFATGGASPLAELPVQYADFALWQRGWLAGDALARELDLWRERLAGAPEVLDLPLDRPRPALRTFRGERRSGALPAGVAEALPGLARSSGATLFMTLLAAWKALLWRHGSQPDVVVGTPIANRTRGETDGLIGCFVNTLVLRTSLAGRPGFAALLARVRQTALAAYAHQDLPFEQLVAEVAPERRMDHTPLFQVMFVLHDWSTGSTAPPASVELPGLRLSAVDAGGEVVKFDLTLIAQADRRGGLDLRLGYNSALFHPTTIDRLLGHLAALLAAASAEPDRPLGDLPLFSPAERHQLLLDWNEGGWNEGGAPAAERGEPLVLLQDLFAAAAAERPEAVALVAGETALSYRELERRAASLAGRLVSLGVTPEERVGICLPRSFDLLIALLGVLQAGAAYVPIDPANPRERVLFLLADSRVPVLVSSPQLAGELAPALAEQGTQVVGVDGPTLGARRRLSTKSGADGLAYVIYTSGSTGTPNGVLVSHRAAVNLLRQACPLFGVGPESRVLQIASPGFDASVLEIFLALGSGASLCFASEDDRLAPAALAATLERQAVTTAVLTPSLLSVLAEPALVAVKAVSVGGEACSGELAARWSRGRRLLNCYGPTETAIFATVEICAGDGAAPPIGRPVAGVAAHVVARGLDLVPAGVAGELAIGGAGVARGYLDRPARTAERFVPDPWSGTPGARLYRTGDRVRQRADGRLEFLGRLDDQVKLRGYRVELGEIEVALAAHPAVAAAVVLAPAGARDERRLVAFVAAERATAVAALRGFLAERLPAYMVPAEIHCLPALPVTTGGKVDRAALARLGEARGSGRGGPDGAAGQIAPRDPAERFVAGIWQEVLGRPALGVEESFFDLGGSSIQAAILTNLLQERLGEVVHVVVLFDAPTVAELARYLVRHYPRAMARATGTPAAEDTSAGLPDARIDAAAVLRLRAAIPPLRLPAGGRRKNPRAVFILSPPRSGSTLLRVMLAGHPDLFAPPELELLGFATLAEREAAFSGRYALWREGMIRATMEALGEDAEAARLRLEEMARRGVTTGEAYGALQGWIGPRLLVDKTPSYALDPATLARAEAEFESPLYIHLLRHPCGMIASFEKAKLEQVFFRHPHDFSPRRLAELLWVVSQENIRQFLAGVPVERQHAIRFESLVRSPREELVRLSSFLGVPFAPGMLDPYADGSRKMTDGIHALSKMVGDVKFHTHRQVDAQVAESWRADHAEEDLGAPARELAAALGYGELGRPGFSCLVPLATGPVRNAEPALFLVHPVGGNVYCYRELALRLGEERPVYGLQSMGLAEGVTPQETVAQMSASYLAEVRRVQPRGPYHLAGWSIGGVLAWEMAQQLRAAGEEVGLLALLDTRMPAADGGQELDEALLLYGLSRDLAGLTGEEAMVSLDRLRELDGDTGLREILRWARQAGALPVELGDGQAARLWQVYRSNVLAVHAYEPRPYGGPLALFAARRDPAPGPGWERLGGAVLASRIFDADHYSLLRAPVAGLLAEALRECLKESRAVEIADPAP